MNSSIDWRATLPFAIVARPFDFLPCFSSHGWYRHAGRLRRLLVSAAIPVPLENYIVRYAVGCFLPNKIIRSTTRRTNGDDIYCFTLDTEFVDHLQRRVRHRLDVDLDLGIWNGMHNAPCCSPGKIK